MCVVANGVKSWLMCYSLDIHCAHVILNLLHEMASGVMAELQRSLSPSNPQIFQATKAIDYRHVCFELLGSKGG